MRGPCPGSKGGRLRNLCVSSRTKVWFGDIIAFRRLSLPGAGGEKIVVRLHQKGRHALRLTGGGVMRKYRCYFLDAQSHIIAAEIIECADDAAAQEAAARLLNDRQHHAAELWDGSRRVARLEREAAR